MNPSEIARSESEATEAGRALGRIPVGARDAWFKAFDAGVRESEAPEEPMGAHLVEATPEPLSTTTAIPPYYRLNDCRDVFDIARQCGLSFELGSALKYIIRAGRKDAATKAQDLAKAGECVAREIEATA